MPSHSPRRSGRLVPRGRAHTDLSRHGPSYFVCPEVQGMREETMLPGEMLTGPANGSDVVRATERGEAPVTEAATRSDKPRRSANAAEDELDRLIARQAEREETREYQADQERQRKERQARRD